MKRLWFQQQINEVTFNKIVLAQETVRDIPPAQTLYLMSMDEIGVIYFRFQPRKDGRMSIRLKFTIKNQQYIIVIISNFSLSRTKYLDPSVLFSCFCFPPTISNFSNVFETTVLTLRMRIEMVMFVQCKKTLSVFRFKSSTVMLVMLVMKKFRIFRILIFLKTRMFPSPLSFGPLLVRDSAMLTVLG